MIKQGRPPKEKIKQEIQELIDQKGLNFTEAGIKLRMSKQLVWYHYYRPLKKLSTPLDEGLDKQK